MKQLPLAMIVACTSVLVACGGTSSNNTPTNSSSSSSSSQSSSSSSSDASGGLTADYCEQINTVEGFASMESGTTGGADLGDGNYVVGVSTGEALREVVYSSSSPYQDKPLTIYIDDLITWENSGNSDIRIERSDVSIIGRGENAGFEGVGIEIKAPSEGVENIIVRNLRMRYVPQSHGSGDIISLDGRDGPIRNIWIDHNELYNRLEAPESAGCTTEECNKNYHDELVSGRGDVGRITISYNHLHDSWKTSLWGSSDSDEANRTVTFHHNLWQNVNSRLPLFRYGELHVFNNYYLDVESSGINVRQTAEARIDGNVFNRVSHPIVSLYSDELGYWEVEDNAFIDISSSGSCGSSVPPCEGAHEESTGQYTPPYDYDHILMPAQEVPEYVFENAGADKIDACLDLPSPEDDANN
ncbi:pectate lyase [Marinimicrobium koreense]|uniref:Pectate lyase n=1 Tax=Marinimicrobium koreense TaxID=306545 RepID=A0A3N1NWQ3_9GAMM|nr:pectate lyase [Marinimicrobium koreense]ROQ20259.1 pectate lyase [Marinimicrobium koreense]